MADIINYITVQEAAEIIGMTTSRVRQCLRQGELKGVRKGKVWLILESEALRYRDANPDDNHIGRPRVGGY